MIDRLCILFPVLILAHVTKIATSQSYFVNTVDHNSFDQNVKYFDFITGGLKRLFWANNWTTYELSSGSKCVQSVIRVQDAITKGSSVAFSMVDASSSTPPGFLTGSLASLGDFDQCLKVKSHQLDIDGNYCLLEISLSNSSNSVHRWQGDSIDKSLGSIMPLLDFFLPRMSLCVPSSCSSSDVLQMVTSTMDKYPFQVTKTISCQSNRFKREALNWTQIASIAFLGLMWTLCVLATIWKHLIPHERSSFAEIFSLQCNWRRLFYRSSGRVTRNRAIDQMKILFSLMFISMHAIGGTDNPFSPLLLAKMANALEDSSRAELQIFFSENLAEIMFLLTGYVTVTSIVTFLTKLTINRSAVNLIAAFMLSKWMRVVPLIFSLLALEFTWPFLSTGPFYTEASNFVVTNCYNYWWSNVLLVANWFPSIEKCCPQLFHSCVDFQLTLVALGLILILTKSTKAGLATSLLLSTLSMVKLYHNALKYSVIPNYVSRGATIIERMQYIDVIQLPTFAHLPAYILGVLCAYKSITRTEIFIPRSIVKVASYICYLLTFAAVLAPVLHNSTNWLTPSLVPLYIVAQKIFYVLALLPLLLPLRRGKSDKVNEDAASESINQEQFDFLSGLSSLTFCSYLINFYVIRFDFMTARIPFEPGMYSATKRFVFSVISTYSASGIFYLLLAGPFEEIRKMLLKKLFFSPVKDEDKCK